MKIHLTFLDNYLLYKSLSSTCAETLVVCSSKMMANHLEYPMTCNWIQVTWWQAPVLDWMWL